MTRFDWSNFRIHAMQSTKIPFNLWYWMSPDNCQSVRNTKPNCTELHSTSLSRQKRTDRVAFLIISEAIIIGRKSKPDIFIAQFKCVSLSAIDPQVSFNYPRMWALSESGHVFDGSSIDDWKRLMNWLWMSDRTQGSPTDVTH